MALGSHDNSKLLAINVFETTLDLKRISREQTCSTVVAWRHYFEMVSLVLLALVKDVYPTKSKFLGVDSKYLF
jgi:hypothetical protein